MKAVMVKTQQLSIHLTTAITLALAVFGANRTSMRNQPAIPMIMAGPSLKPGLCETPVSLLDLSATITSHFGTNLPEGGPGRSLKDIADLPGDSERVVFSEYHAVGAVSGAFMIRKGNWKYNYYVGFEPELFDLKNDPEEMVNLAGVKEHADKQEELHADLLAICGSRRNRRTRSC